MKHNSNTLFPTPTGLTNIFSGFVVLWVAFAILCCVSSGVVGGAVGYAIYRGLSLAERAVAVQETR